MGTDAATFDRWYADMARSDQRDQIVQRALGLPPELDSSSLLPWLAIAELVMALALAPGQLLADLACGRGGYGLEVARRTGARLIGVDFSAVALAAASRNADRFGLAARAGFRLGHLTASGLDPQTADAVMCIDAIQFASPPVAALREFRRILVPGGRLAVSGWMSLGPPSSQLPDRLRRVRLDRDLAEAGFGHIEVTDKPEWRSAERAMWEAALQADPAADPAIGSLQREGRQVLGWIDSTRRVLATATAGPA
jgi:ubiquinone/menaquinone biosynthesis C-methylase UbiE